MKETKTSPKHVGIPSGGMSASLLVKHMVFPQPQWLGSSDYFYQRLNLAASIFYGVYLTAPLRGEFQVKILLGEET